jgi:hypothetical protein
MTGSVAVSKDGPQYRFVIPGTSLDGEMCFRRRCFQRRDPRRVGLSLERHPRRVRSFVLTGGKMARPKRKREIRRAVIKLTHYPIWNQLHVGEFRSYPLRVLIMKAGHWIVLAVLLGMLSATIWIGYDIWETTTDVPISENGYIPMGVGAALSLLVGCGLMALLFYSSRHGYDEPPHEDNRPNRK